MNIIERTRRTFVLFLLLAGVVVSAVAQERRPQHKPYIDLRPMHFGISVGLNMQDIELQNVGPQLFDLGDGEPPAEQSVLCDADTWNPGFSVGVVADMRLSGHLALRITPSMHFGSKRLTFRNLKLLNDVGQPTEETQDLKNTYIAVPVDLKFSAQRWNNYRPYILAGVSPMINLSGKDQDFLQLKRYDTMVEVGLGCDFYLPFFKLIPELKFCYSLTNSLNHDHVSELTDINKRIYAESTNKAHAKMIVLTFYFE